ncbi:uncharacterized protein PGTG_03527 [Puccinia graminis f. sp. tritici CRL 75-36-700-3]|uniref:Uncharacterized protein n=1 Tax=Puccinia graminis f. sp. tritici (strain CRL 75-36-700-3 / race SCCL) TaxID=418459 RepID=E3JZU6_PUCGT|nr:uncharacterized protein PGTG_03527 [Puccinia graminis f. sp. tritici CRL 75-36-700-3]EFP77571.1 hypothetical protein PGTG_03527 [Puccinia graminis f. sp. tritici CRL 75-36-700-3]
MQTFGHVLHVLWLTKRLHASSLGWGPLVGGNHPKDSQQASFQTSSSEGIPSDKLVDNGKDNPFSAASPAISNLLPLGNWPSFSQSNSLNHGNFGGLLSPASNQLSPIIGPSSGPSLSTGSDNNWATVIPDQLLEEKQDIPDVDQSAGPEQPAAPLPPSLTAQDTLASPSKTASCFTNQLAGRNPSQQAGEHTSSSEGIPSDKLV